MRGTGKGKGECDSCTVGRCSTHLWPIRYHWQRSQPWNLTTLKTSPGISSHPQLIWQPSESQAKGKLWRGTPRGDNRVCVPELCLLVGANVCIVAWLVL